MMIAVPAYYDGTNIKPLGPINVQPNKKIFITVVDESMESEKGTAMSLQAFKNFQKCRKQEIEEVKNRDSIFDAFAGGLLYIADDFDETPECFEEYL